MNGIFDLCGPLLHSIPETIHLKEAKKEKKQKKRRKVDKNVMIFTELYNSKSEDLNVML